MVNFGSEIGKKFSTIRGFGAFSRIQTKHFVTFRTSMLRTTLPIAHFTPKTHASLAHAVLYFASDDERLERRHRRGQVLAVINFQRLADNLRLFVKTAKVEVCCEW